MKTYYISYNEYILCKECGDGEYWSVINKEEFDIADAEDNCVFCSECDKHINLSEEYSI